MLTKPMAARVACLLLIAIAFVFSAAVAIDDDADALSSDWIFFHEQRFSGAVVPASDSVFGGVFSRLLMLRRSLLRESVILDLELHEKSPPVPFPSFSL